MGGIKSIIHVLWFNGFAYMGNKLLGFVAIVVFSFYYCNKGHIDTHVITGP